MSRKLYGIVFVRGRVKHRVLSISMLSYAALSLWMKNYLKQEPSCLDGWDGYEIIEVE